jgi:hypothetical protein
MNKSWIDTTLKVRLPIVLVLALITYILTFYISAPERTNVGNAPEQPIPFSHKLHAGTMQIDCQYCHTGVAETRHAGIPAVSTCMNCHTQARIDRPAIQKLKEHFDKAEPIEWKRIHRVPEYVYFDHSVHIAKGFDCAQCHGAVEEMDIVRQDKRTTMGRCISCHKGVHDEQPGITSQDLGPLNCSACHR